ncbi:hypothetical protein HELRODRAFT_152313, partial [Helobdella robusta]|uniref:FUN14 domain-containing protein n=1 Tax=Helobdella robusta TaxID=6412 RepID=T1EKQ8_HELRO
ITKGSVAKQILIGASIGVCSGLVLTRVGKPASAAIGGTLLFIAVANNQGWIKINWSATDKMVNKARKKVEELEGKKAQVSNFLRAKRFIKRNISFVAGFLGGFSLGVA